MVIAELICHFPSITDGRRVVQHSYLNLMKKNDAVDLNFLPIRQP